MNFTDDMKMTRVRLCGLDDNNPDGIQGFISDGIKNVPLTTIGNISLANFNNCFDWVIDEDSWIAKVLISYDTEKLNYIKMWTERSDVSVELGQQGASDSVYEVQFD